MTPLTLKSDSTRKSTPGNFNAVANSSNNTLIFPEEIISAFSAARDWHSADGQNALSLLSCAYSFPTAAEHYLNAAGLSWSVAEVQSATMTLVMDLTSQGLLDQKFSTPRPQRAYGALPPPGWTPPKL